MKKLHQENLSQKKSANDKVFIRMDFKVIFLLHCKTFSHKYMTGQ